MERVILHSDANAFYASVECALNPSLRGLPVAVCGSVENRHGIVLAKSESAKRAGITTGMTNGEAKRLCKELIIVPPRHDVYELFSERLHEIYLRYTDRVEPFGLDECWIDGTGLGKSPDTIADEIRSAVKEELQLTVSIGISFNKVFAKLGSDMKKPDAVTKITRENYREKVWNLPCSDLLYCGRATTKKLALLGVRTVGELAKYPLSVLRQRLGKNGEMLWRYANGLDDLPVSRFDEREQAKSVGHGITCVSDLTGEAEVEPVLVALAQDIGRRLRQMGLRAKGIQLTVRDCNLKFDSWQTQLSAPTQCADTLVKEGLKLLKARYRWENPVRAVTLSAINLERTDAPVQLSLFAESEKRLQAEETVDRIRERFGTDAIKPAALLLENKLPPNLRSHAVLPKSGK